MRVCTAARPRPGSRRVPLSPPLAPHSLSRGAARQRRGRRACGPRFRDSALTVKKKSGTTRPVREDLHLPFFFSSLHTEAKGRSCGHSNSTMLPGPLPTCTTTTYTVPLQLCLISRARPVPDQRAYDREIDRSTRGRASLERTSATGAALGINSDVLGLQTGLPRVPSIGRSMSPALLGRAQRCA